MDFILRNISFTLPISNPVLIFAIVLFVILLAPLFDRIRVPRIMGMILAGVILGEHGLGLLSRDESFELFGTVGLVYIMFLAGLEMDHSDFKKNRKASISFGVLTFLVPMVIGCLTAYPLLRFLPYEEVAGDALAYTPSEMTEGYLLCVSCLLLASMYASHTLVTYPTVARYGVTKNRSVSIAIGGTMITTTAALLLLAILVGMAKGEINGYFWTWMGVSVTIFLVMVGYVFPKIASLFFKLYDDSVMQYIFILALVFLGSFVAQMSGLEAIIGAFLVGLSINKFIPKISPLMNRLEFVGNAIFIPFFLISVGMLVDLRSVFHGGYTLVAAIVMCAVACLSKYIAAAVTERTFRLTRDEGRLLFGLSNAQAAATLAAVKIGYDTIVFCSDTGQMVRLFGADILNGTIVMILVTCTVAGIVTERSASKIALSTDNIDEKMAEAVATERILVPLHNPDTISSLMEIAVLQKQKSSKEPLFCLHVAVESKKNEMDRGKKLLEKAARIASATDNSVRMISRYDRDVASGIIHSIKENQITELVIGLHHKQSLTDTFFGKTADVLLSNTEQMVMIVKSVQPLGTIKRLVIVAPPKAHFEVGFVKWYDRVKNICKQIGASASFFADEETLQQIRLLARRNKFGVQSTFEEFADPEEFLILTRELQPDDLLVVVTSRKSGVSYTAAHEKLGSQLARYFADYSFIVLYPEQNCLMADKEIQ